MGRRRDLERHLGRTSNQREARKPMTPVVNCARKPTNLTAMTGTWQAATGNVSLGSNAAALRDETPEAFVARCQQAELNGKDSSRLRPKKASMAAWERSRDKQRRQREYNDDLRLDTTFVPKAPKMVSTTHKVGPTTSPQKVVKTRRERELWVGHRDPIVAQQSAGQSFSAGAR